MNTFRITSGNAAQPFNYAYERGAEAKQKDESTSKKSYIEVVAQTHQEGSVRLLFSTKLGGRAWFCNEQDCDNVIYKLGKLYCKLGKLYDICQPSHESLTTLHKNPDMSSLFNFKCKVPATNDGTKLPIDWTYTHWNTGRNGLLQMPKINFPGACKTTETYYFRAWQKVHIIG